MDTQKSTQEQLKKITEFRQEIYSEIFKQRRDAQFELLDALLQKGKVASFPWYGTAACFRRQWSSLYDAIEQGSQDQERLWALLVGHIPAEDIQHFALDVSGWGRPHGRTLADRQYVYQPGANLKGRPVVAGYPYSWLDWVPMADESWSLTVNVARVGSNESDWNVGAKQVKQLCANRVDLSQVFDIIAGDCKYSSHHFLAEVKGLPCGIVVRARRDRVLYGRPQTKKHKGPGRPRKHGQRFAFKEPDTWGQPDEWLCLDHPKWGHVELQRWNHRHSSQAPDIEVDVIRAQVHLERTKPPEPLWLFWLPPSTVPVGIEVTASTIWHGYDHRWPIEPNFRFRKQTLCWVTPQFHTPQAGDRWTVIVALAVWMLFLARPLVEDCPLPWQPRQSRLTPDRVRQGYQDIFSKFGTPAKPPQTRGYSPGWPRGQPRTPRPRYPVVKKQANSVPVSA
jgi:hypothetical protein